MKKIIFLVFLLIFAAVAHADVYVPIYSDIYGYLRRLEALGYIKSGELTTLPLSVSEVKRLVKEAENSAEKDATTSRIIDNIKELLPDKSIGIEGTFQYSYTEDKSFLANKNNYDIDIEKGANLKLASDIYGSSNYIGLYASPYFLSNERYEKFSVNELYTLFTYKKLELSVGKENQWWGGGENGSILLSNNAEGLNVFKVSNSTPIDFIIPFRFTFFLAKLENNRTDVQSPYINGIRLTLKPSQYLEIGLSKTAMYGGRGRKNDFGAFLDSLIGNKEKNTTSDYNREPGDQRAGFDLKFISPNSIQPFTFYIEAIGEDVSHDFPYPYKYAYLTNLYLPKVFAIERLELLAEYAQTTYKQTGLWYHHHIFKKGYTYNGDIIGNFIGADAKDFYLKATYNFQKSRLNVSYERYRKYIPNFVWEAYAVSFVDNLTKRFGYSLDLALNKEDKDKVVVSVGLKYKF